MSDEKQIRDLFERLVAMSPDPPPYPEETIVVRPARPRRNPVLAFALAVLVVALAAIPVYLLGQGAGDVAEDTTSTVTTTTVASTQTTEAQSTTTSLGQTTSTQAPTVEIEAVVFLMQMPENAFVENPALVPFSTLVEVAQAETVSPSPQQLGLEVLFDDRLQPPPGFQSMVPADVELVGMETSAEEHLVRLDMNRAFLEGAGGLLADLTMLNQIIFTATGEGYTGVLFTVDGKPIDQFGSEGLDLTDPVGRESFLDHLNLINLDSPLTGSGEQPLIVSGIANVYEATVSLDILDGGEVVHQEFANATCGTGCWGFFSFSLDYPFTGSETIRVYQASAENGEPTNVVSVPVLWDSEGWPLIP